MDISNFVQQLQLQLQRARRKKSSNITWISQFIIFVLVCSQTLFPSIEKKSIMPNMEKENKKRFFPMTYQEESQPYFVLHVGPQKTGTTNIQTVLSSDRMEKLLLKDNYAFIGAGYGKERDDVLDHKKPIYYKINTIGQNNTLKLSTALINKVKKLRQHQTNIIASSEYLYSLSEENMKDCWRRLLFSNSNEFGGKWNLQVVVSYRRLFSYLPSMWNQIYRHFRRNQRGRPVSKHLNWPGIRGDYAIIPFPEWFSKKVREKGQFQHLAKQTYDHWATLADGIGMTVVSIHEEGDFAENFLCRVLKGAKNVCSELSSLLEDSSIGRRHESVELDYDMLGVYAYRKGLINHNYSRIDVYNAIEEYAIKLDTKNYTDYSRKCLDRNMTNSLRNWSLEFEKWFHNVSKSSSLNDSRSVKATFEDLLGNFNSDWESTLERKKLCSIDAEKTMTIQHWKDFFTRFH